MAEPNNRRMSLRPIFEPFDLLDDDGMQPLSTNGFRSDSLDEETNLFAGLHFEPNDPSAGNANNSANKGATGGNGMMPHASPYNHAGGNGISIHRPGFTTIIDAANGAAHGAFSHSADRIADELENDPDIADLVAAKAAFAMSESRQETHDEHPAQSNGDAHHFDAPMNGDALRNSERLRNGEELRNGDVPQPVIEPVLAEPPVSETSAQPAAVPSAAAPLSAVPPVADHAASDFLYVQNPGADFGHFESNGAAVEPQAEAMLDLAPPQGDLEIPPAADEALLEIDEAQPVVDEAPPVVEDAPPVMHDGVVHENEAHEELVEQADEPTAPPADDPGLAGGDGQHPARGSMFVPYLVTEIRELRNRSHRRKSWWRRLFG